MQFHQGSRLKKIIENKYNRIKIFTDLLGWDAQRIQYYFNAEKIKSSSLEPILEVLGMTYNDFMGLKSTEEMEDMRQERDMWKDKYYSLLERFSDLQENSNILNKKIKVKQL